MTLRKDFNDTIIYVARDTANLPILGFSNRDKLQSLYGRVDPSMRAIAPLNSTALDPIPGTNSRAMNFVVDAFVDLQAKYQRLENPITGLPLLRANKGYTNPIDLYDIQLENLFVAIYANYVLPMKEKIKNMDDFVNIVLEGFKNFSRQSPITYSGFVKSRLCPMHTSGLVIELLPLDHGLGTMAMKRKILRSPSFPAFSEMLSKTGFVLHRHAPWCLIANIKSGPMMGYYSQYIGLSSPVYSSYFYNCRAYDLDKLRGIIKDYYETLFLANEQSVAYKVCKDGTLRTKTYRSARMEPDKAMESYNSKKWFYFYVKVRVIEENVFIADSKLDRLFENCYSVLIKEGIARSLDYMERKILEIKTDFYI